MTSEEQLAKVKEALGIEGEYHDSRLLLYMNEVKEFLRGSGIPEAVLSSSQIIGTLTRGVSDLWNYGAGEGKLSEYFLMRVTQLSYQRREG